MCHITMIEIMYEVALEALVHTLKIFSSLHETRHSRHLPARPTPLATLRGLVKIPRIFLAPHSRRDSVSQAGRKENVRRSERQIPSTNEEQPAFTCTTAEKEQAQPQLYGTSYFLVRKTPTGLQDFFPRRKILAY